MDVVGMVAVLGAFSVPLYALRARHEYRKRRLELEAGKGGGNSEDTQQLRDENRLLRERVENLESIVCSVDFELNQKVAKLLDEQRSMVLAPANPGPMQIAAAQAQAKSADAKSDAK